MQFSPSTAEVRLRYEGDWQEGKMAGFGQMKYKNGSEYTGHWKNDERVGHGTLKTYSADGGLLQTVYVGDWQNDQKNGYGVQDFLVRYVSFTYEILDSSSLNLVRDLLKPGYHKINEVHDRRSTLLESKTVDIT